MTGQWTPQQCDWILSPSNESKKYSQAITFLFWLLRDDASQLPHQLWRAVSVKKSKRSTGVSNTLPSIPSVSHHCDLWRVNGYSRADLCCARRLLFWTVPNNSHSYNTDGHTCQRKFKTDLLIICTVWIRHQEAHQLLMSLLLEGNLHLCRLHKLTLAFVLWFCVLIIVWQPRSAHPHPLQDKGLINDVHYSLNSWFLQL